MPTPSVKSPTVIDRIRRTKVWFARYVGEPVAVVLAGNRDTAEDALEQIVAGSPCTPRLAPSASPKASKGNDGKPDVSRRVGCPKPVWTIRGSMVGREVPDTEITRIPCTCRDNVEF